MNASRKRMVCNPGRVGALPGMGTWKAAILAAVAACLAVGGLSSCATMGRDFPDAQVEKIVLGTTTQQQVRDMFGEPWRVGLEDGKRTWTYGRYKYKLFGHSNTKDLVIRFNDAHVVASYTFNTTEHEE